MPPRKPPLVMIEWEDSAQAAPQWKWLSEIDGPAIAQCVSAGFLVHDGKREKRLAVSIGCRDGKAEQASGIIAIPTRCITKLRRIRP